jgi:hypothetical protein
VFDDVDDPESQRERVIDDAHVAAITLLAEEAVDWMNEQHAVLNDHGKTIIITPRVEIISDDFKRRVIDRSQLSDLQLRYRPRTVQVTTPSGKITTKRLADYWIEHPRRKTYDDIVMDPGVTHPANVFNLWQGFAVMPRRGSWSRFREHLYSVGAAGNDDVFRYLMGWLARAVQKPGRPAEVAYVMRGAQGTGKGLIARTIGHLFGQHFVHVSRTRHLTGNFNAHLQDAVFVFADEAVWGGDRQSEGALKALITEPTLPIERKGVDTITVKNTIHLILASNNDWCVPSGMDDRRFCVVDVPSTFIDDHTYFARIVDELQHGGYEALLFDLLAYDLSSFDHRKPPQTDAGLQQKLLSMTAVQKWWTDKLVSGEILPGVDWCAEVERTRLHDNYVAELQKSGVLRRGTATELGRALKALVPRLHTIRRRSGYDNRARCWVLPNLATCRAHFEKLMKQPFTWETAE